jgi:hypothetical protein
MQPYNAELFDPPAPVAYVVVRNPINGKSLPSIPMLLDTGADITLVPSSVVDTLELIFVSDVQYELANFDGQLSNTAATRLELIFGRRTFRGQFLLIDQAWGILGRNVLNALRLTLDGPQVSWYEQAK